MILKRKRIYSEFIYTRLPKDHRDWCVSCKNYSPSPVLCDMLDICINLRGLTDIVIIKGNYVYNQI